jgi:hypothetical protein
MSNLENLRSVVVLHNVQDCADGHLVLVGHVRTIVVKRVDLMDGPIRGGEVDSHREFQLKPKKRAI